MEQGKAPVEVLAVPEEESIIPEEVQSLIWSFHQTFNELISGSKEWSNLIEKYTNWELKMVIESGTLTEEMVEHLQVAFKDYINLQERQYCTALALNRPESKGFSKEITNKELLLQSLYPRSVLAVETPPLATSTPSVPVKDADKVKVGVQFQVSQITETPERSDFSSPVKTQRTQISNQVKSIQPSLKQTQKSLTKSIMVTPLTNNRQVDALQQSTGNGTTNMEVT